MLRRVAFLLLVWIAGPRFGHAQDAGRKFAAAQVKADLAFLYQTLEAAHYNLYANTSKRVFRRELRRREQAITGSLTPLQVNRLFQPFVALAGHGHCITGYPFKSYNAFLALGGQVFPFDVRVVQRRLFVTGNYSADSTIRPGDEVLAIYDVGVGHWLDGIYTYLSGENEYFKNTLIDQIGFPRLFWMVYDQQKTFSIKVRKASGQVVFVTDAGVPAARYRTIRNSRPGVFKPDRAFQLLDNVAYLRPGQFLNNEPAPTGGIPRQVYDKGEFVHFIDSAFAQIRRQRASTLLLDLRGNPGGDNSFSDPLVAYFATKPFQFNSSFSIKTSSITKSFWQKVQDPALAELKNQILSAPDGSVFQAALHPYPPRPDSLRFTGPVYVLVDRYTYSNATTVAALIQDYKFGQIIGEPTAESPTLYAAVHEFELPHTKIGVTYPKAFMVRPNGRKSLQGVTPDLRAVDNVFTPEDEALQWALNYIKGSKR